MNFQIRNGPDPNIHIVLKGNTDVGPDGLCQFLCNGNGIMLPVFLPPALWLKQHKKH